MSEWSESDEPDRPEEVGAPAHAAPDTEAIESESDDFVEVTTAIDHSTKSTKKVFSWREVSYVAEFVLGTAELGSGASKLMYAIFGGSDAVELAQSLYPPTLRLSAVDFVADLLLKVRSNELSFTDGIKLNETLSSFDATILREIVRTANLIGYWSKLDSSLELPAEAIRYRKNMSNSEILTALVPLLAQVEDEVADDFSSACALFDIWPYGVL